MLQASKHYDAVKKEIAKLKSLFDLVTLKKIEQTSNYIVTAFRIPEATTTFEERKTMARKLSKTHDLESDITDYIDEVSCEI